MCLNLVSILLLLLFVATAHSIFLTFWVDNIWKLHLPLWKIFLDAGKKCYIMAWVWPVKVDVVSLFGCCVGRFIRRESISLASEVYFFL